jgi:hypothetical protein
MRTYERDLGLEPWPARTDFSRIGPGVYPPLTARFPFEVFHYVRYVDRFAIDACLLERAIEQLSCRSDERMTGEILRVARLLADEHQASTSRAFAEDRLCSALVQVARLTAGGGFSDTL